MTEPMPSSKPGTPPTSAAAAQRPAMPGSVRLMPLDQLGSFLAGEAHPPLAVIAFGDAVPEHVPAPTLLARVELQQLGDTPLVEVWTSNQPVSSGMHQEWRYSCNDTLLFGLMDLEDSGERNLEDAALEHYEHLFDLIESKGYPSLLRMWNYFPAMHEEPGGLERYKRFCLGRHQAFENRFSDFESTLPAASAIGTQSGSRFTMYFIASRQPGSQVENPRQVSAFCYPPQYGPASPSFSRATYSNWRDGEQLYLSGTASVVGHESTHPDDVQQQTLETLSNIEAVCGNARATLNSAVTTRHLTGLKVYIRNPADKELIRDLIRRHGLTDDPILYLQGDICRTELLLEIEGLFSIGD